MNYGIEYYIKYFEHQASSHPDLAHHPDSNKIFELIDVEDALGDLRTGSSESGWLMRLLLYSYELTDSQACNAAKEVNGGFIIAKKHSHREEGRDGLIQAMAAAEKVTDEILEKMISDSQNGHPFFNYSLNLAQNIRVIPKIHGAAAGYSGYICTFYFSPYWRNNLSDPAAPAWSDAGQTPTDL